MIYKHGPISTLGDEYSLMHKTNAQVCEKKIGVSIVNQGKANILIARVLVKMLVVISQAHLLSQLAILKFGRRVCIVCAYCKTPGHLTSDCYKLEGKTLKESQSSSNILANVRTQGKQTVIYESPQKEDILPEFVIKDSSASLLKVMCHLNVI